MQTATLAVAKKVSGGINASVDAYYKIIKDVHCMTIYAKTFVQYGTEPGHVYTTVLKDIDKKKKRGENNCYSFASMSLDTIASNKSESKPLLQKSLSEAAQHLKASMPVLKNNSEAKSIELDLPHELRNLSIYGNVIQAAANVTVTYGAAMVAIMNNKNNKMKTDVPVVHFKMVHDGAPVLLTSVLCGTGRNKRTVCHFISTHDKCVSLRSLNLNRRSELQIDWPPVLSHFLRRSQITNLHTSSFKNLGLQVENTEYCNNALFHVLKSTTDSISCFSIFF
jgi:hypothetical protein